MEKKHLQTEIRRLWDWVSTLENIMVGKEHECIKEENSLFN